MNVISTETLIRSASEAMFEENDNFTTDIEHVIDFLNVMADNHGFEIVRCKDCKYWNSGYQKYDVHPWLPCMEVKTKGDWFCADGERKE